MLVAVVEQVDTSQTPEHQTQMGQVSVVSPLSWRAVALYRAINRGATATAGLPVIDDKSQARIGVITGNTRARQEIFSAQRLMHQRLPCLQQQRQPLSSIISSPLGDRNDGR